MQIAIIGLALSHPYAFAGWLRARGHTITAVWDADRAKAYAFASEYGAVAAAEPAAALGLSPGGGSVARPDGAIITSRTCDHFRHARLALEAGIPTYVDKLMVLDPAEAKALIAIGTPFLSGSALRFLPDFQELVRWARNETVLAARAEVYHGMAAYLQPGSTWQDDPAQSGGVLMNMGVHAVDLLVAALGPDWQVTAAETARRVHHQALSEDQAAILLRGPGGQLATVQVVSGTERHYYGLALTGASEDRRWQLPDPTHPVTDVYGPMLEVFLETVRTNTWQVPLSEMVATVRILAEARKAAG